MAPSGCLGQLVWYALLAVSCRKEHGESQGSGPILLVCHRFSLSGRLPKRLAPAVTQPNGLRMVRNQSVPAVQSGAELEAQAGGFSRQSGDYPSTRSEGERELPETVVVEVRAHLEAAGFDANWTMLDLQECLLSYQHQGEPLLLNQLLPLFLYCARSGRLWEE